MARRSLQRLVLVAELARVCGPTSPTYEPHPPFYYSLLKLWRAFAGDSALCAALFSGLFAAADRPGEVAAANEFERQRPSGRRCSAPGIAAFLVAGSPMLVLMGRGRGLIRCSSSPMRWRSSALLRLIREFGDGSRAADVVADARRREPSSACGRTGSACSTPSASPSRSRRRGCIGPIGSRLVRGAGSRRGQSRSLSAVPADDARPRRRLGQRLAQLGARHGSAAARPLHRSGRGADDRLGGRCPGHDPACQARSSSRRSNHARLECRPGPLLLWWGPPLLAIVISSLVMPIFLSRTLTPTLVPAYLALGRRRGARPVGAGTLRPRSAALAITSCPLAVSGRAASVGGALGRGQRLSPPQRQSGRSGLAVSQRQRTAAARSRSRYLNARHSRRLSSHQLSRARSAPARLQWFVTRRQADAIAGDPHLRDVPTVWLVTRQSGIFDPANDVPLRWPSARKPGADAGMGLHQRHALYPPLGPFRSRSIASKLR